MFLRRFFQTNRDAEADRSSLENDRTPTYTSNVTTAPTHTDGVDRLSDRTRAWNVSDLSGCDSVTLPESSSSPTDTLGVTTPRYIYYRIYAEDGAIPSKTPATPGDPFIGRIKARSVPPPHTAEVVKRSIAKLENIKDDTSTSLFLTSYSQSPMDDAGKVTILNRNGPESTPQEPLALVAKMSDSERSALESGGRGGLTSAAEPDTTPYLYYLLYADKHEMPSKVAMDPQEPSLGRIRVDSIAPPHSAASIKRCISRVERTPALARADLFADTSCNTPMKEGHISILCTDGPGLNPNEPMAIVQVESPSIPDGTYLIKNRAADIFWSMGLYRPLKTVYLYATTMETAEAYSNLQWHITQDSNGDISITSRFAPSWWVQVGNDSAEMTASTVPVPWRLIKADSKSYYLTTDIYRVSQNPLVPAAQKGMTNDDRTPRSMATLKKGDQWQMWEFIQVRI